MKGIVLGTLLVALTGCQSNLLATSGGSRQVAVSTVEAGGTIQIRIGQGLKTQAAPKTLVDLDHFVIKLYDDTQTLRYTYTSPDSIGAVTFTTVPNGTYSITAEAFDASNASITQAGAQASSNTATVASPNVSYSDGGTALTVGLKLLDGTGESFGSEVTVTPGSDYSGPISTSP